jgi:hypothetical protein
MLWLAKGQATQNASGSRVVWREGHRCTGQEAGMAPDTLVRGSLGSEASTSPLPLPSRNCLFHLSPDCQQVCVLGLHLAKELCEVDEDGDSWLQVTRRLPILPTLLTTLEVSLRMKQNLHFTEAALHLLLTLARTQQVRRPACAEWFPCKPEFDSDLFLPWANLCGLHLIMGFSSREPQQWLELASPRASVCPS